MNVFPTIALPDFSAVASVMKDYAALGQATKEAARLAAEFTDQVESTFAGVKSYFDQLVIHDRALTYFQKVHDDHLQLQRGLKRHDDARILISAELPKRGWYLSGQEPCRLTLRLADAIRARNWDVVDQMLMTQLPEFKPDVLPAWLAQEGVPDYCANRVLRCVKHHQEGNFEEATYLGVPLLDEVAKYLYNNRAFTTKRHNKGRGNQSQPELALKTSGGRDLKNYCLDFLQTFGSLQEDTDYTRLSDENYWNRSAIVHGLMQRPMGLKDSAKCLMALKFLFFARETEADAA